MDVTLFKRAGNGEAIAGDRVTVYFVVTTVHGDLPMRAKFMRCLSHAAFLHCPFCWTTQTRTAGGRMRVLGYAGPSAAQRGPHRNQQFHMADPESVRQFRRTEQELRNGAAAGMLVVEQEATEADARRVFNMGGMKGKSCIVRLLYYVQYTTTFLVPFMHTFFRGVLRDYLVAITATEGTNARMGDPMPAATLLPRRTRVEMEQRMCAMVVTSDFNRPGRDPVRGMAQCTMEELAHMCDVWLPLLWYQVRPCATLADSRHC